MPIATECSCGRKLRVKDEFAGKKVRCPECKQVLTVSPPPEAEEFVEVEAVSVPLPRKPIETAIARERPLPPPVPRPASTPRRLVSDDEDERPRRKKRRPKRRRESRQSGFGLAVHPSIVAGLLMTLGAVVWFVLGLMGGIIFFYPPILFVLGIAALVRGFLGQD